MTSSSLDCDLPANLWGTSDGMSDPKSDELLMRQFSEAMNEASFIELTNRYEAKAFRVAFALLGNRDAAEDAVQDSFFKLIRARNTYGIGSSFSNWFFGILRNVCRDEFRRRQRVSGISSEVRSGAVDVDPEAEASLKEDVARALSALSALPEKEREALTLRLHAGFEFVDIASVCCISVEAAKKRVYRGLDHLREQLKA